MKAFLYQPAVYVLLLIFATNAASAIAIDDKPCEKTCQKVVVVKGGESADCAKICQKQVVMLRSGEDGEGEGLRTLVAGDGEHAQGVVMMKAVVADADGNEEPKVICVKTAAAPTAEGENVWFGDASALLTGVYEAEVDPSHGWLGVSLGEVNPGLAAQLGLGDEGVVIANVVKDSPAEGAGLQQHDIILTLNGESFGNSVDELAKRIRGAGSGTTVPLAVIRTGKEMVVNVTLGSRPTDGEFGWQYKHLFMPSISDQFSATGKVIKLGEDGEVVIEELGDLAELENLPEAIKELIPDIAGIQTKIMISAEDDDETSHVTVRVGTDRDMLEIERQDGGEIIVRRITVDEDGDETTEEKIYTSEEELKAGDEEAYDLFSHIEKPHVDCLIGTHGDAMKMYKLNLGDWADVGGDIHLHVEDTVEHARKAFEEAMKGHGGGWGGLTKLQTPFPGASAFAWHARDEVTHNFNVDSEGRIEIKLRKDDSEVILNYDSVDELEKRNPELYEKFAGVLEAAAEE